MSLNGLRKDLEKKYPGLLLSEQTEVDANVIPTGSLALDYALGSGGWARGTYSGIFGERNVGKSSLALIACANAQKLGLPVAYISTEGWHKADWEWARRLGVDTSRDDWIVAEPSNGEDAFSVMGEMVQGGMKLIVMDSLAAMVSRVEAENDDSKARVGGQSGLITYGVKRWNIPVKQHNVCVLMLNHARDDMGSPYRTVHQPGGKALENLERVIVRLRNTEKVKEDGIEIGRCVVATIERTKFNEGEGHRAEYWFYNAEVEGYPFGLDVVSDLVLTGKRVGAIDGSTWLILPDGTKHQGKDAAGRYILAHPEVHSQLREIVLQKMVERGHGKLELLVNEH